MNRREFAEGCERMGAIRKAIGDLRPRPSGSIEDMRMIAQAWTGILGIEDRVEVLSKLYALLSGFEIKGSETGPFSDTRRSAVKVAWSGFLDMADIRLTAARNAAEVLEAGFQAGFATASLLAPRDRMAAAKRYFQVGQQRATAERSERVRQVREYILAAWNTRPEGVGFNAFLRGLAEDRQFEALCIRHRGAPYTPKGLRRQVHRWLHPR
jgi:hypothetical protein